MMAKKATMGMRAQWSLYKCYKKLGVTVSRYEVNNHSRGHSSIFWNNRFLGFYKKYIAVNPFILLRNFLKGFISI